MLYRERNFQQSVEWSQMKVKPYNSRSCQYIFAKVQEVYTNSTPIFNVHSIWLFLPLYQQKTIHPLKNFSTNQKLHNYTV